MNQRMKQLLDKISDDEFKEIVANSSFHEEVYKKIGYAVNKGGFGSDIRKRVKARIERLNICTKHFWGKGGGLSSKSRYQN